MGSGEFGGLDGEDIREAAEVSTVQGEEVRDAVNAHVGRQTGIVDLHAADFVGEDESLPFGEDFESFREDGNHSLQLAKFDLYLGDGEAKPVLTAGRVETFQNSAMF